MNKPQISYLRRERDAYNWIETKIHYIKHAAHHEKLNLYIDLD